MQWTPTLETYVNYDGQLGRHRCDSHAVTGGAQDQPLDKKRLQPCFDFRRTRDLKETLDGFLKIMHRLLNRFPLASDIEFRTKSRVAAGFLGIQDST